MRKQSIVLVAAVLTVLSATTQAADNKLGKLFVKAATTEVNGQAFPDAQVEESVKDIKKRPGKFGLVEKESDAEFLIIVVERKAKAIAGQPASKVVVATLSVRDGAGWKPATKLQSKVIIVLRRVGAQAGIA
jgi:hypothetical protein